MKKIFSIIFLFFILTISYSQVKKENYTINKEYDSRIFLTQTQKVSFKKVYPEFDNRIIDEKYEWNDVDPLKLFSNNENRIKRRNLFLYEHNPNTIGNSEPTEQQFAFSLIIKNNIINSKVIIDSYDMKISFPYTENYEGNLGRNLLEKLSDLGLQWSQLGGNNLYFYNENILIGKYKNGYVTLSNLNIEKCK